MWLKYKNTINRARNTTNIGFFALFSYILLRKWGEKTDILKKRAKFTHPPPSNWPPPSWDVEIVRNTRFDFLEKKSFFEIFGVHSVNLLALYEEFEFPHDVFTGG